MFLSAGGWQDTRSALRAIPGAECVTAECPFCTTMLEAAVKARLLEETMWVHGRAELVAEPAGVPSK